MVNERVTIQAPPNPPNHQRINSSIQVDIKWPQDSSCANTGRDKRKELLAEQNENFVETFQEQMFIL